MTWLRSSKPQPQEQPCPNCGKVHPNGAQQAMPAKVKVGQPAPEMRLVNLEGKTMELGDFKGQETVVLD